MNGKKVLITGCSTGIGFDLTKRLAKEGNVVIATTRKPDAAVELQKLAKVYPNNIMIEALDLLSSNESIRKFAHKIGKIDILINNAGYGLLGSAFSATDEEREDIFTVNYLRTVTLTNEVLRIMLESPNPTGKIIFMSSIVGPLVDLKQSPYSASKAALEHYAADLRYNLKKSNYQITVAGIHPGPVHTRFPDSALQGSRYFYRKHPFKHAKTDYEEWRELMDINGQPVSQTVETVLKVIESLDPDFWNPTHPDVKQSFSDVYHDTTGRAFAGGPGLKARL